MQASETTWSRPNSGNDKRKSDEPTYGDLPSPVTRSNPHRKYSRKWMNHAWSAAVRVGRWPRVTYLLVGIVIVSIWIGVMIYFAEEEVRYERANLRPGGSRGNSERIPGDLVLKGVLKKFDPVERSLRVAWSLVTINETNPDNLDEFPSAQNESFPINIYRDVIAIVDERSLPPNITEAPGDMGFGLRIDNVTAIPIAVLGKHTWDDVTTDIDFAQAVTDNAWQQPLFAYPFDQWSGQIVLAAADRERIEETGLRNGFAFGIDHALLADSTLNWRISLEETNTCLNTETAFGCELHLSFTGSRPALVKFAAIVAALVNWVTTIGIFLIVCESVVLKRSYILKETDILAVCLTALFALPSVRLILPGAPDFGAINLIGIIPNIIIISLCTTVIAVAKLRMRPPLKDE